MKRKLYGILIIIAIAAIEIYILSGIDVDRAKTVIVVIVAATMYLSWSIITTKNDKEQKE